MRNDFPQITKEKGLRIPHSGFRIPDSIPSTNSTKTSLKKAVKNRVQYHGERCNRGQFIALWNTTF